MIDATGLRQVTSVNAVRKAAIRSALVHCHEAACQGFNLVKLGVTRDLAVPVQSHLEKAGFDVKRAGSEFPVNGDEVPLVISW